ncbi:carbohydrate ABC transporter permease [Actinocatenispora rupis]|uniref:ABC transporter permease n=1 Tax=Actinocatenispora rupis TaxID=519421 RepID=A0A8J3J369_9ACTN|nr:carbohydrate ABC transporter permease [Actinocatenispora rupis]GID11260.1 ABC transporter permease [Actinocatenispora rupis]
MTTATAAPERTAAAGIARRAARRRGRGGRIGAVAAVVVIGCFGLLPVYWLVVTAFSPTGDVFAFPPRLVPAHLTLAHFDSLLHTPKLVRYLVNSVVVSLVTAVLSVVVSAYCAYSFSKFRYRGRRSLMYLVLASQMFPQALLLITIYLVFSATGLLNSYGALVLSFTTFTLPLCIWMLKGFFDTIPDELIEAARVDGAAHRVVIHRIMMPIATPGLIAAGLFAFIRGWNDFIFALTLAGPDRQTLPPGLVNTYVGEFQTAWPDLMAASLVSSLPVVVAFIVLQRHLVAGLASGAVKG